MESLRVYYTAAIEPLCMPLSVVFTCDSTVYPVTSEWRAWRSPHARGPVVGEAEGAGRGGRDRAREHERGAVSISETDTHIGQDTAAAP